MKAYLSTTFKIRATALALVFFISASCNAAEKADLVLIDKSDRVLWLMHNGKPLKQYKIALGGNPIGHKQQQGDQRTPEGRYLLDYKNAKSAFHRSIHVSYPNTQDKAHAKQIGVNPGGQIMIHGQKNGFGWLGGLTQFTDWTDGCIAVKDAEMDEIWDAVAVGTPVQINP